MAARNLTPQLTRRELLGLSALGAAGVAVVLTGCSADQTATSTMVTQSGLEVGPAGDVPVGGGANFTVQGTPMVVTQEREGAFKAFSAVCTHQGCLVGCRDKEIVCDCHQATYDMSTGKPTGGPAQELLQQYAVVVTDGVIYTA
ncbi:nitrite reductase/ring-hydroxylating ferredoxin subunit [Aurantimicrobium minutum]|uniref:Rieske (2Fe-2S) protein n=1 Tax=Aurantimicrobium minutum TaxID=708131 RepID=UPI002475B3A2|nr:Rieske (2Fe-2S) protein [Aurantimicrobium minutum]MDH6532749.1 nitrite reductase/ring-hydroxylating ferredoxin subunit [Aurantimicrobium minutum]